MIMTLKLLWSLNINTVKFFILQIKSKRTLKQNILLILDIFKQYFKANLQIYRYFLNNFNPEFRVNLKKAENLKRAKKEVLSAIRLLQYSKNKMKKAGISRQQIRRFFLELGKNDEALQKLVDDLLKEMEGK